MYSFISPTGEIVKTKTIKAFANQYGFRYSNAKSLACGHYKTLNGWCSTSPTAKKARERFQTVLVNIHSGKREILGRSIQAFGKKHHVCANDIWKVVNGCKIGARGWVLAKSIDAAQMHLAGINI